jgi:hypothetical protein
MPRRNPFPLREARLSRDDRALFGGHPMLKSLRVSLALLSLAATPALAQETIDATDPTKLEAILKGFGVARIEANSNSGNPQIDGRADGKSYKLFFYGCSEKVNCKSVQFWAYWDQEAEVEKLNAFNKDTRYGKVYLDDDKDVILEFDVNMVYGISEKTFEDNADIWVTLLGRVDKDVLGN